MRSFLRLLGMAKRHLPWMALALASMVVVAGATVFAFNLVRPIYDHVLRAPAPSDETPAVPTVGLVRALDSMTGRAEARIRRSVNDSRITILALAFIALVVKNLGAFLARFASARFGLAGVRDVRNRLFESLLAQSPAYFRAAATPVMVARATHDAQLIREALAERLGDAVQDVLMLVVLLVYLLSLDLELTLVTAVVAPLLFFPVVHFSRRLRDRARQAQQRTGEMAVVLDESVRGLRVVQIYGMESFLGDRFRRANQRQFLASLGARVIQAANAPVMEIVGGAAALAITAYASSRISGGDMSLGDFSAYLLAAYAAYNPLKRLNKFNLALQQAEVAAERIFEVIDAPVEIRDKIGAREVCDVGAGLRLESVVFAYEPGRPVLRGVDLEIRRGSTVALVGPSGAGKSTIAQLIPRFWDVLGGAVLVGGDDVRDLRLSSLRGLIGLVTQETILFNDTVRSNITCGRADASASRVEEAARAADAHGFISDLPQGYDTMIGESGMSLSGGQRQRLAIARAVFKDPPILILDEATSALDPESEISVQGALDRLMRDRTTLVIAHRLATVRRADLVAVLVDGRIVERGTHDHLTACGGIYRRMVEMQELS